MVENCKVVKPFYIQQLKEIRAYNIIVKGNVR
jgi:hypothetical protein